MISRTFIAAVMALGATVRPAVHTASRRAWSEHDAIPASSREHRLEPHRECSVRACTNNSFPRDPPPADTIRFCSLSRGVTWCQATSTQRADLHLDAA